MGVSKHLKDIEYPVSGLRIVNAAYRKRPDIPQGGPAGVQRLTEDVIGALYRGIPIHYSYERTRKPSLEVEVTTKTLNLSPMVAKNLRASENLESVVQELCNKNYFASAFAQNKIYFVLCHDIGSALGALDLGFPFSLVYHQQGAACFELEAAGTHLNSADRSLLNKIERLVFENAEEVYFPSLGAQNTFFETTEVVSKEKVSLGPEPLYNTVADLDIDAELGQNFLAMNGLSKLLLPEVRKSYRVIVSVGDYNDSKGMERSFEFACSLADVVPEKILWIGIGRRNNSGKFTKIQAALEKAGIETLLIGERLPHDLVMSLVDFSDQFVMMQRHSIFDFSSIEAMALAKSMVLSPVGGNLEFNKANNIAFYNPDDSPKARKQAIQDIAALDLDQHGALNKKTFEQYFSKPCLEKRYLSLYDRIIDRVMGNGHIEAGLPVETVAQARCVFKDKDVLIVGPGHSAASLTSRDFENKTIVALNSALEIEHIPFNAHFMQDEPTKVGAWKNYYARDVHRFYGRVSTPGMAHIQMNFDMLRKMCGSIYQYNLAPDRFDPRHSSDLADLSKTPVLDMQSIAFTAMQIIGFAGARSISLAGVDFSPRNYAGANPNRYAASVLTNLRFLSVALRKRGVSVEIAHTTSQTVHDAVYNKEQNPEIEGLSAFRTLQWFERNGKYAECLEYIRTKGNDAWLKDPKYLREIAQIHFNNGHFEESIYFFGRFFSNGGESKICRERMGIAKKNLTETVAKFKWLK